MEAEKRDARGIMVLRSEKIDGSQSKIGPKTQPAYLWKAESMLYKICMGLVRGFRCKKIRKLSLKSKMMLVASLFASAQTKRYNNKNKKRSKKMRFLKVDPTKSTFEMFTFKVNI